MVVIFSNVLMCNDCVMQKSVSDVPAINTMYTRL